MIVINNFTKMETYTFNNKWIFTVCIEERRNKMIEVDVSVKKIEAPSLFSPKIIGGKVTLGNTECESLNKLKSLLIESITDNKYRKHVNLIMDKVPKYVRVALLKYIELLLFLLENEIGG